MSSSALAQLLRTTTRQLMWRHALCGAAIGAAVAAVLELLPLILPTSDISDGVWSTGFLLRVVRGLFVVVAAAGIAVMAWRPRRAERSVITLIEGLLPQSRNLLFTAWELRQSGAHAGRASDGDAHHLVQVRAEAAASQANATTLMPLSAEWRNLGLAALLWCGAAWLGVRLPAGAAERAIRRTVADVTGTIAIAGVDVRVVEPSYTGRAPRVLRNPDRIEALEHSRIEITVSSNAPSLLITTDSGEVLLERPASGDFTWQGRIERDGFVAITARRDSAVSHTDAGAVRTVSIFARHDAAPAVRILEPGHDLIVDSTRGTLAVRIDASDDMGLRSLQLPYTKVSGSGERFTFTEGLAVVNVQRESGTHWSARAVLALDLLLTEAGDLVVYRARVADARPDAEPVESDAFIAERLPDGGVAAAGFSLDPDGDRYAVSQQMVILKTERLMASRASLTADRLAEQARAIGNEQRRVRAEFVFMTGGEFEQALVTDEEGMADLDESHEAESEADLAAGRMVNRGRAALMTAIRAMSRAALSLNEADLTTALRHERTALENLQEAFARQRFLMRALSEREQLDLTRRLTGSLDSVSHATRPAPAAAPDVMRRGVQAILAELSGPRTSSGANLPVRVLQLEPGSMRSAQIAALLQRAGNAPRNSAAHRMATDSASLLLSEWLASLAPGASAAPRAPGWRAVDAALQRPVPR